MAYAQEAVHPYNTSEGKKEQVEQMFNNIAHSYDLLNHLLSLGIDRSWRRKTIEALRNEGHGEVLDVATGTGDFAILACERLDIKKLVAVDISEGMMDVGRQKVEAAGLGDKIEFKREDCEHLSFADSTFDAVISAYGIRNLSDLDAGLREILRVLKPGGVAALLELCVPRRFPMKQLFWLYSHAVMPLVGRLVSHDGRAYCYLPATMERFPQGERMKEILMENGFSTAGFKRFTFGLSTMYIARK